MDSEAVCQHLFTRTPSELFHSPTLAFEFIQFCRDNLPQLGRNLSVLKLSFPNLFKARSLEPGPEWGAGCLSRPAQSPQALPSALGPLGASWPWPQGSGQVAWGADGLGCRAEGEVGCPGGSTCHR